MIEALLLLFGFEAVDRDMPVALPEPVPMEVAVVKPPPPKVSVPPPPASPKIQKPSLFPVGCEYAPPDRWKPLYLAATRRYPSKSDACALSTQTFFESSFNPNADSGLAVGLCQFKPSTAKELQFDPWKPRECIPAMAKYVQWCQNGWTPDLEGRTDVDIRGLGLCCYNGGRGYCFRNQAKHGWVRLCDAMPHLYEETSTYIKRIENPAC